MAKVGESAAVTTPTTFQVTVLRSKQTPSCLPVGTILHMLSNGPVQVKPWGGICSIFESVKNLDRSLLHVDKQTLVEPKLSAVGSCKPTGLIQSALEGADTPTPPAKKRIKLPKVYYRSQRSDCTHLSIEPRDYCKPCCTRYSSTASGPNTAMTILPKELAELEADLMHLIDPIEKAGRANSGQGFVKENITYIVTDSLEIMPSTTIRSINVLNKLHIPTLADLESTEITITITEVLGLLQSAMTSNSSLNDVFGTK